jgi:ribosome-associated protein
MTNNKESSNIIAELESEFVELYKILKFEGLSESGGMAKQAIAEGQVSVNGQIETRKRKKIFAGDKIEFSGQSIAIESKTNSP